MIDVPVLIAGGGPGPGIGHDDPDDRDPKVYDGTTTVYSGGEHRSYVLLPVIPAR